MKPSVLARFAGHLGVCRKLMLAAAFLALAVHAGTASAQTPFYDAPRSLLAGEPGTLVRQETIDGAPLTFAALRRWARVAHPTGCP